MEEHLVTAVGYLKLAVEAVGAAIVGFGALATVAVYFLSLFGIRKRSYTEIRLFLGRYLALGLEFQLGSDILSTAVAPTIAEVKIWRLSWSSARCSTTSSPRRSSAKRWRPQSARRQRTIPSTASHRAKGDLRILGTTRGGVLLERVMNLGENRKKMRIPRSPWFPCDLRFPHS